MNFTVDFTGAAAHHLSRLDAERRRFLQITIHSVLSNDPFGQTEATGYAYPRDRFFETVLRDGDFQHSFVVELTINEPSRIVLVSGVSCDTRKT